MPPMPRLTGGENCIDIGIAGSVLVASGLLELLSGTRHDGNNEDLRGIYAHLLCIIGFANSTEHLLGALAGAYVGDELGIVILKVSYPSG